MTSDVCLCGCGEPVPEGRRFRPGHDLRLLYRLARDMGGIEALKTLVESHLKD